ncbi:hypothetical protein PPERSA_06157 [Pseudocohnilembus persalinus]|uniref:Uncharacterized protein n=1 Tax=Pseudocohnilembus persalinus TaxID=266149 RepID=A0A0V0QE83_PSEPJ|nr:hypothetical protein PPERSA_06157 [Pseudocohnilembus persalinus]|eukprot:KRX00514.1 hypothetical protein PPERSA_06157 [Pseudocohnilembus persalinus]
MYDYNSPLQNKQEAINQARQLYAGQRLTPQNSNIKTQEDIQIINNNKTQQNQDHYESPLRRSSHQKFNPFQYMNDGENSSTNNKYEDNNSNSKNMLLNKDALNNLNLKRNSQNNILFSTNIININNRKNSLLNRVKKPSEKLNHFDSLQKSKMPSDSESHNRNCSSQSNQHNYSSQDTQKNNIEALEDIISQKSGQQSPLKKRNMSLNRLIIPQKILYDSDNNNNNQNNFNNNKGISKTDRQSIDKMILQADEEIQKNRKRKSKSRQFSKEISNFSQLPNTTRSLQTEENNTNNNNNSIKFDKSEVFNSQNLSPTKNNSNSLQGSIKKEKQYNFSTNFSSARQTQEQQQQLQSKENIQMQNFSSYFSKQLQQNKSNQNSYMNTKEFLSPVNNRQNFNSNLDNGNSLMHKRNSSTNQFSLNLDNNNINERLNSLNLLKNNQENQSLLLNRLDQRSEKFIRSRVQFTDSNQNKQNSFIQNSYLNNNSNNKNINFVNTEESLSMSPLRRSPMREKQQQLQAVTQQDSDHINTEYRDQSPRKQSDRDKFLKQIKKNQEFEGFSPLIQRKRISVESQSMLQKDALANQNNNKINKTSQIKNTEHNNSNSNINQENKNQNQNQQQQQQFELQNNTKVNKKTSSKNSNSIQNNNTEKTGLDEEKQTTKLKINSFNEKNQPETQSIKQLQQNNINNINKQHFVGLETHDIKQNGNINDEQEKQSQNQKSERNTETNKNQTDDKQKKLQINLIRLRQKKRISFNDIIQNNSNSNSKLSPMKKENSMDTINAINNMIQNNRANTSPEKQVKGILKAQSKYSDQQTNSKDLGAQFQSREQNIVKNKRKRKSKQVQFNSEQIIFDCKDEQKK